MYLLYLLSSFNDTVVTHKGALKGVVTPKLCIH